MPFENNKTIKNHLFFIVLAYAMLNLTGTCTGESKLFYTLPFQFGITTGTVLEREENGQ